MVELRRWQVDALQHWRAHRSGIVAVVTGGGKTVFALAAMREALDLRPELRLMVLVPSVALQEQWLEEIGSYFPHESVGTSVGGPNGPRFVILVNDTARKLVPLLESPADWMQVVDECHRAASTENRQALMPGAWARLGLSATPERQYDELLETVLVPALGPIIYRYSYAEALSDGVVAEFDLVNYRVPMTPDEQSGISRVSRRIATESQKSPRDEERLRRLLLERARLVQRIRSREPVAVRLVAEYARGRSSIVFHESTAAADRIAESLQSMGIPTSVYHSGLAPTVRRRDLHLFRLGATSVMVCCRALDEGLNVPRAKFAVIAASTATTRQRIQRLGRMLRPDEAGSRAVVATLYATQIEADRLVAESAELEGLVRVSWYSAALGGRDVRN